jgi:hypothetical protein
MSPLERSLGEGGLGMFAVQYLTQTAMQLCLTPELLSALPRDKPGVRGPFL